MAEATSVRVRFAPSPTGYLHVGGSRTALYNFLFAKKQGGSFLLRIEDTDLARSTDQSLRMVMQDLLWLGLHWDEGPSCPELQDVGDYGPYRQSQRLNLYREYAERLLSEGKAYYCFMTDEELEAQRQQKLDQGLPPHVDSPYRHWSLDQAREHLAKGHKASIRFKTHPEKKDYVLQDLIRGEVRFPSDMVGDFVLLRSDGMPVYNFCNVIDDHLMQITHVLRAEEHLPNTLRQLMIYEAFSWTPPQFGHLSLILDEERKKLSKRKGATSCHEFRLAGYLPQALNNFMALLGWSHPEGKELLSMTELQESFDLSRMNPAGAVFDPVKLNWMNAQYLKQLSLPDLVKELRAYLSFLQTELQAPSSGATAQALVEKLLVEKEEYRELPLKELESFTEHLEWFKNFLAVEQAWIWLENFRNQFNTLLDALLHSWLLRPHGFVIHPADREVLDWPKTPEVLRLWAQAIEKAQSTGQAFMLADEFLRVQDEIKNQAGVKGKELFMPLRLACIGKAHGPELKLLIPVLPLSEWKRRVSLLT
ncbi:MAG: glutamate--tRNA ligase [Bdellovibrionaceae bacterium]|nr:glutamate--tRNA ligase [Pseudobdellovibrionaceae bacterium]